MSELEQLGNKLIRIQVGELGIDSKEFVVKTTNQSLLSACKHGLQGDTKVVLLAANPKSIAAAIEIALDAESSMKDNYDTGYVNANNKKRSSSKLYNNGQSNNNTILGDSINNRTMGVRVRTTHQRVGHPVVVLQRLIRIIDKESTRFTNNK